MAEKAIEWLHRVRSEPGSPWFMYYSTGCSHARTTFPREWADRYTGRSTRVGRRPRGDARAPEGARRRSAGHRAAENDAFPAGLPERDREASVRASDGDLRRLLGERGLERRPRPLRDRGDGRARRHPRDLDLGRQRRQPGGHPLGHLQRDDDAERDPAHHRAADGPPVQARRPRGLGRRPHGPALLVRLGVGEQLPLRLGQAGRLPPRRDAEPARGPLPEGDLRRGSCAATSRT